MKILQMWPVGVGSGYRPTLLEEDYYTWADKTTHQLNRHMGHTRRMKVNFGEIIHWFHLTVLDYGYLQRPPTTMLQILKAPLQMQTNTYELLV